MENSRTRWGYRLSGWSKGMTIAALFCGFGGVTAARYDLIGKIPGFLGLLGGGALATLALIAGLVALVLARGMSLPGRGMLMACLVVSGLYSGFLVNRAMNAAKVPAIHDVTTDIADPPSFSRLPLRPDNLVGVGTVDNWKTIHAAAYGDLAPLVVAKPVAEVVADATRLAREEGWDIAVSDTAAGRVEATASVSFIRFKDDVVLRITPEEDGKRSRIDMRSVSRVGVSDMGMNAKRIRAFLAKLAQA